MSAIDRQFRRQSLLRRRTVVGLSALAVSGLFATYLQALRSPSAYATTNCTVTNTADDPTNVPAGSLRACITAVNSASGGTITFAVSTLTLATELPTTNVSFSIDGGANGVTINGGGTGSDFRFLTPDLDHRTLDISHVTFQNFDGTSDKGGVLYINGTYATLNLTDVTAQDNYNANDGGFLYWDTSDVSLNVTDSTFARNGSGEDGAVFYIDEGGYGPTSTGVTITRSTFTDNVAVANGGVLYVDSGDTTITNSTFTGNDAEYGGAVWLDGETITITGTTFENNTVTGKGGAGYIYDPNEVFVTDSTFKGNQADNGASLYDEAGDELTVTGSTFEGNTATTNGAGIYGFSPLHVTDTSFIDNSATYGAAIYDVGDTYLTNVSFVGNSATASGGAIYQTSSLTGTNVTFAGNTAYSGAAFVGTNVTTLTNTTITGNTASYGYIVIPGDAMTLNFSTIAGNTVPALSAAVAGAGAGSGDLTLTGTVISQSTGSACKLRGSGEVDQYSVVTDASCSLTGTGSVENAASGDIGFATADVIPVNGVLQTVLPMAGTSILASGAPAGDLSTGITTDQVGTVRETGNFTIGARQYGVSPTAPTSLRATPGDGEATVAFTGGAPGSHPITNYQYTLDNGVTWIDLSPAATGSPVTIRGLTNGTSYTIKLRAVTNYGISPWSAPVTVKPGPSGQVPRTPLRPVLTTGNGKVTITVHRGTGGGTPTSFRVTAGPGGGTCTVTASTSGSCTITGLTNGTLYTFRAVAINAAGASGRSAASETAQPGPIKRPTAQSIGRFLKKGQAVATEGGTAAPITVDPNMDANGIDIEGDNFAMGLDGLGANGKPMNLGADGVLVLATERDVLTSGEGFLPATEVDLYVDPEIRALRGKHAVRKPVNAIYVGTVTVKADGTFQGTATLPDGISKGTHDLQAIGVSRGNLLRVMTLGVYVTNKPGAVRDLAVDATSSAGTAALSWNWPAGSKIAGIDHYLIGYRPAWTSDFVSAGRSADPDYVVDGLVAGCPYVFRVRAVNGAGRGPWSYTDVTYIPTVDPRAKAPRGDYSCLVK